MEQEEKHESIQAALRFEFETANEDRAIEIYNTSKKMNYKDQAEEMASDILTEFNIDVL